MGKSLFKATLALVLALALAPGAASAQDSSSPENCLDACVGGEGFIHVTGWAYDPDEWMQSIDVHVYLYADSNCATPYGDVHVLTADVMRTDVNRANSIRGKHGFDAEIPVSDAGTYWVKLFAIDTTGDDDSQIGPTTSVTVTAPGSSSAGSSSGGSSSGGSSSGGSSSGGSSAEYDCTVKVTKFHQSYPYSGKATVKYTVGGTLPANAVAEIVLDTGDASAIFVQPGVVTGANTNVIDFASSFGGALLLTNASFAVTVMEDLGGVRLWENGPCWATCNVGAENPEDYGYYFWWGDTVGYTNSGGTLTSNFAHPSIYSGVTWVSSTGEQMGSSPFTTSCPTYDKEDSELLAAGYIDSTTNLVAAHDAATAHLGAPWRMPTSAEIEALVSNCNTTWITNNGVNGRLVTGKGAYANRSIFLPAAGFGSKSNLYDPGTYGYSWASTPISDFSYNAWNLFLSSSYFKGRDSSRYCGQSVRPVRDSAICGADGIVTYDSPETHTTPVRVPYAWLDAHVPGVAQEVEAHEAAANATAANGRKVWQCYAAGMDPTNRLDDFRITHFWLDGGMPMFEFNHTTDGSGNSILPYIQPLGKASLTNAWQHVPDGGDQTFRFFAAEVVPPGCESSFGRTPDAAFVDIPVAISWNDNGNEDGDRPASVIVRLYADGVEVDSHVLTAAESWQFTFVGKMRYQGDNTTEIAYTVGEDAVALYAATVGGYNIVNDYRPEVTSVSVSKVWHDSNDEAGYRPSSIAMSLSDWKKVVKVVVLNEANGWTATVDNLPTVVDGQPAQYAWEEQRVLCYWIEDVQQEGKRMIFTNKYSERPVNPTAGNRPRTRGDSCYVFEDYDEEP